MRLLTAALGLSLATNIELAFRLRAERRKPRTLYALRQVKGQLQPEAPRRVRREIARGRRR